MTWSGDRVREARAAYVETEPVTLQKDYMFTVTRLSSVARQVVPPATRLEHMLYPWVYFAVLPLFALTNADVSISGDIASVFGGPAFLGVFFGLLAGKPIGILLASAIVVKTGLAKLPEHVNWRHMVGAAVLGGVGFTMAIFVANLAYDSEAALTSAKLAILLASAVAGVAGFAILSIEARAAAARGVEYVEVAADEDNMQHADREGTRQAERMLDRMSERDCRAYRDACVDDEPHELEVTLSDDAAR